MCSGKSTVAQILGELGAKIIDADEVSRAVSAAGTPVFEEIVLAFGKGVLDSGGSIDRAKLGKAVFSDPEKRKVLERITHPAIRDEVVRRVGEESAGGATVVVIEAALLSRGGVLGEIVDTLVLVDASEEVKIKRVAERDGLDETEAKKRLKAQEGRNPDWDFVIDNSGGLEGLRENVESFWRDTVKPASFVI